jgi:flagellum-specific peptidoglycan hydrolase FlgJ
MPPRYGFIDRQTKQLSDELDFQDRTGRDLWQLAFSENARADIRNLESLLDTPTQQSQPQRPSSPFGMTDDDIAPSRRAPIVSAPPLEMPTLETGRSAAHVAEEAEIEQIAAASRPSQPVELDTPSAPRAQSMPQITAPGAAAAPAVEIDNSSRESFIRTAYPHMLRAAGGNQDAAEMMLATAISENGSIGTGKPIWANNMFGIKGKGDAGSANAATWEQTASGPVNIRDNFAAYSSPTVGAGAFFQFLEDNPRYAQALGRYRQSGDASQLFRDVNAAGYATDPQWASKVENIRRTSVAPITRGIGAPPQQTQGDQAGQPGMSTVPAVAAPSSKPASPGSSVRVVPDALPNSYWTSGGTHGGAPAADIFAPIGSPILAPVSGQSMPAVYPAGGNATTIKGDDGKYYYMAHGNVPFRGGRVEAGQPIGQVGNTGNARGTQPHLHYAIATNPSIFSAKNGSGDIEGEAYWRTPDGRVHSENDGHNHGPAPAAPKPPTPNADAAPVPASSAAPPQAGGGVPPPAAGSPSTQDAYRVSLSGEPLPQPMPGTVTAPSEMNPPVLPGARLLPGESPDAPNPEGQGWQDRTAENSMYRNPLGMPTDPEASTGAPFDPDAGPRESGYTLPPPPVSTYNDPTAGGTVQQPVVAPPATYAASGDTLPPPAPAADPFPMPAWAQEVAPAPVVQVPRPTAPAPVRQAAPAPILPLAPPPVQTFSDPREADQGPREATPGSVGAGPVGPLYGPAPAPAPKPMIGVGPAEQWVWENVLQPAIQTLDAANEWRINSPLGNVSLQGLGRELGGWGQISAEVGEDTQRLQALVARRRNGDTTVDAEIADLTASLNQRMGSGRPLRERLLEAGERNPDKTAEIAGGLAEGALATILAPGLSAGPVRNAAAAALDPIGQGLGAALEIPGRAAEVAGPLLSRGAETVTGAVRANAERVAAADARMAAEGSTTAPGALGIAMGTDAQSMVRPRVVPPDVADTLDFPIRLPEDPAVIRAIEAAGGSVDPQRGVDLNVIRNQDTEAAGGVATRGAPFYIAAPPGAPNPYASNRTVGPQGVGGQQRIEGKTRFRSPLFISAAPGEAQGFDDGMRQIMATAPEPPSRIQGYETRLRNAEQQLADVRARKPGDLGYGPQWLEPAEEYVRQARAELEAARAGRNPILARDVEEGIREAKRAGPAGSPERAAALKELVTRYGGDPDLIDPLMALRGADMGESVFAIKENILAHQARAKGYDGVITVQKDEIVPWDAISSHPDVVATKKALDEVTAAATRVQKRVEADLKWWQEHGSVGDPLDDPLVKANADEWEQLERARETARQAYEAAVKKAQAEFVPTARITELMDPREARNPTPAPRDEIQTRVTTEFQEKLTQAQADWERMAAQVYTPGHKPTPEETKALTEIAGRVSEAERVLEAIKGTVSRNPPGYTLRSDIPIRPDAPEVRTSTITKNTAMEEAGRAYDEAVEEVNRLTLERNKYASNSTGYKQAQEALKEAEARRQAAWQRWDELEQRGESEYVTANASAGTLPPSRTSDPLSAVNRVLSQGVASSVSGGVGAAVNQEMTPDDPNAALTGFAVGALGPMAAARGVRAGLRAAGRAAPGAEGALAALGNVPTPSSEITPIGRRVMETYRAITPQRVEASTARTLQIAADAIAGKIPSKGGLSTSPTELVRSAHAAIVRNLQDTKVVATGLRQGAIEAFLRGEGLTSKVETRDLPAINRITQGQVNVAGGRAKIIDGKKQKVPYSIDDAADFAQRESLQMEMATGGTRFPDPETGVIDDAAPRVNYAYVSEGQPLVGPNRPNLWLVWNDETPRITTAHHAYALGSPGQDIHAGMPQGLKAAIWAEDAVQGGRPVPGVLEGGRLVEAAPGVPDTSPVVKGWEQAGIDVGDGRKIAKTNWLVGPEGEDAMRANGLILSMPQKVQMQIAKGELSDPEQIAAVLMRGGPPQWKSGWSASVSAQRSESLILDPSLEHVKAIYLTATPKNLAERMPNTGGTGRKADNLTELQIAQRMRQEILDKTGRDVPIIFNDISKAGAPRAMADADVLEGPPLALAPGRRQIVDQYTQAIDPSTKQPYVDIGSGMVPGRATAHNAAQGAVVGAASEDLQAQQEGREADPTSRLVRGAIGAGLGVVPGGRAARTAGRELGAGMVPQGSGLGALGDAFPAAARWYERAKTQNAARMAAEGITPASKTEIVRGTVGTVGYGSMLGPGTAAFNTVAGLMQPVWAIAKEPTRAVYRAFETGNPAALREPVAALEGTVTGLGRVSNALWDVLRAQGKYAPSPDSPMLSQRLADPIGRGLMQALETPGRVWSGAPDAIFGTIAQHTVEARRAAQLATEAGHRGQKWDDWFKLYRKEAERVRSTNAPAHQIGAGTVEVLRAGDEAAEKAAYRQPLGEIGKAARNIARLGNDKNQIGTFVAPFFNSPGNVHLQAAERSPAGLLMNTQATKFDKYYDAMVGSAAVFGLLGMVKEGHISINGSGPLDPNERQAWMDAGNRPYSVVIGGLAIPTRVFTGADPLLNAVGEVLDAEKYPNKKPDERNLSNEALTRIGRLIKQHPYAAGYATIADLAQFGPASALADVATRVTPASATLRAIGTAGDDYERTVDRGAGVPILEEAKQRWQQSVGMREDLPVAQNILGEPKENDQPGAAAFFGRLGYRRNDPVIRIFQDARTFPADPRKEITLDAEDGVKITLTPRERRIWDAERGKVLRQAGTQLAATPEWATLPLAVQQDVLREIMDDAAEAADGQMLQVVGNDEITRRLKANPPPQQVAR